VGMCAANVDEGFHEQRVSVVRKRKTPSGFLKRK
jgi:hypothetical protein